MGGAKIIKAIEDAARGNFERVTVMGQVWVRQRESTAPPFDRSRLAQAIRKERERLIREPENPMHAKEARTTVFVLSALQNIAERMAADEVGDD